MVYDARYKTHRGLVKAQYADHLIKEVYMWKDKVKNILWFLFVYTPLVTANGLGCIILANEKIVGGNFQVVTFRKTKRQIDKEKFAKFMKRVCK